MDDVLHLFGLHQSYKMETQGFSVYFPDIGICITENMMSVVITVYEIAYTVSLPEKTWRLQFLCKQCEFDITPIFCSNVLQIEVWTECRRNQKERLFGQGEIQDDRSVEESI